jgi:hypothetical protein
MMPFITCARSAGGGPTGNDLPLPVGDCALTVTARRKAATVSGCASLELDIISVEIMSRSADISGMAAAQIRSSGKRAALLRTKPRWRGRQRARYSRISPEFRAEVYWPTPDQRGDSAGRGMPMKKLMTVAIGVSLLMPVVIVAQTGGDKDKKQSTKKTKKEPKQKSKKGSGGTTTPPPK